MTTSTTTEEGPRAFSVILGELEDGALHAELSRQLRELVAAISTHAEQYTRGSGSLTFTLRLTKERGGPIAVDCDVATKAPKAARARSHFWETKGHNLTPNDPRQQKLPLREVRDPSREVREPGAEQPVRGV